MFLDLILIQNNLVEMEYNNISVFILQNKKSVRSPNRRHFNVFCAKAALADDGFASIRTFMFSDSVRYVH